MTHVLVTNEIGEGAVGVEGTGTHFATGSVEPILDLGDLITRRLILGQVGGPGGGLGLVILIQGGAMGIDAGGVILDGVASGVNVVMGDFTVQLK